MKLQQLQVDAIVAAQKRTSESVPLKRSVTNKRERRERKYQSVIATLETRLQGAIAGNRRFCIAFSAKPSEILHDRDYASRDKTWKRVFELSPDASVELQIAKANDHSVASFLDALDQESVFVRVYRYCFAQSLKVILGVSTNSRGMIYRFSIKIPLQS